MKIENIMHFHEAGHFPDFFFKFLLKHSNQLNVNPRKYLQFKLLTLKEKYVSVPNGYEKVKLVENRIRNANFVI